jgi:hypothetical protein
MTGRWVSLLVVGMVGAVWALALPESHGAQAARPASSAALSRSVLMPLAKKKCHYVTKKVHGKKKRVKVCTTVKPKATPTPTPTDTPTDTPTTPTPTDTPTVTPTPTITPTATQTPVYEFSFSGLMIGWTFVDPMGGAAPVGPVPVQGSACGADPLTAPWSGAFTVQVQHPFHWNINFSANNPAVFDRPKGILNGAQYAEVDISLQLIPGPNPIMALSATTTSTFPNGVQNLKIAPAQVPIQATQVASCP